MTAIISLRHRLTVRAMRTTFATARGSKTHATSVLVAVELSDGSIGCGEAPTSFVMPHETVPAIRAVLDDARLSLTGVAIDDYPRVLKAIARRHEQFHMSLAGLEVALFRAGLAHRGVGEWAHWGGKLAELSTDITISFVPPSDALAASLARAVAMGFDTYKVKVGGDPRIDLPFVRWVADIIGRAGRPFTIRLDGNQGYSAAGLLKMQASLARAKIPIQLFEQPLGKADFRGMESLRGRLTAPLILDETVMSPADCRRVIDNGLADGVNVKIVKSGIDGSRKIVALARGAGLKLMIGCMTETMVGLSAGIFLAAGTGAFDYVDLDSCHLLCRPGKFPGIAVAGPRYVMEDSHC